MAERLRSLTCWDVSNVERQSATIQEGAASTVRAHRCGVQLHVPLVVFHHDPPPARWIGSCAPQARQKTCMRSASRCAPELAAAA